jgi:hypothetical protein
MRIISLAGSHRHYALLVRSSAYFYSKQQIMPIYDNLPIPG